MPEEGEYLFSNVGFSVDERPYISLQHGEQFTELAPLGKTLTLRFDTTERFCIGWYDMATSSGQFACPDSQKIDSKYEQCPACQQRTGFNPAFYHAASVSKQQEARNLQPHILYLAHFGEGIVKVGISYAARGNSRLLEQGARSALVLDTFPTALIARQYEAQIAMMPGIVETVQLRKKIACLSSPYDVAAGTNELMKTRTKIEESLKKTFANNAVMSLDTFYFPAVLPDLTDSIDYSDKQLISGEVMGMLGTLLFCSQQDVALFLPLKKLIGYRVTVSHEETQLALPARQTSLF